MIGVKLDELCPPPPPSKDGRYCKEKNYFVKLDAQTAEFYCVRVVTMRIFADEKHQFAIACQCNLFIR